MTKKTILTYLLALIATAGQAEEKKQVWENPTTEFGTSYSDGYFYLAFDVTKVELKAEEAVVYITARSRPDSERVDYWFQFAGDIQLNVDARRLEELARLSG